MAISAARRGLTPCRRSRRWRWRCRCWKATRRCASVCWCRSASWSGGPEVRESAIPSGIVGRVVNPYTPRMLDQPAAQLPVAQRTNPERSFAEEVRALRLGDGEIFRGEGILAVTKAILQSGVAYVGGYQGAPV